jgi:uncharacterized membrane protein
MNEKIENMISRDEIKTEFQLERMILFSDAVFAIVITLMAIEIKIPESNEKLNQVTLLKSIQHLLPTIISYIVSFFFIGTIWYQHLKIFSLVKSYDKGLVIRNLVLLFFIGLFPFSASIITRSHGTSMAFFIYLTTILFCITSQYVLQHYIIIKRPLLRINIDLSKQVFELKKKRILIISFGIAFILCAISYYFTTTPFIKSLIPLWLSPVVIIYRFLIRRKKAH